MPIAVVGLDEGGKKARQVLAAELDLLGLVSGRDILGGNAGGGVSPTSGRRVKFDQRTGGPLHDQSFVHAALLADDSTQALMKALPATPSSTVGKS